MSVAFLTNVDLTNNQILNVLLQSLTSDPSSAEAKIYYNSSSKEVRFHNGTSWVALGPAGAGGPPTGAAGGDLSGSYPTPQIAAGVIVDADVNSSANIAQSKIFNLATDLSARPTLTTTDATYLKLAGGTLSNFLTLHSDPSSALHAATKQYVDNLIAGLAWKDSVRVATTANGTITTAFANGQTIDGVVLATGNRILLKNQSIPTENGIYTVNPSGAPTRALDADIGTEVEGMAVFVTEGTTNGDTSWVCTTNGPISLGSTGLTIVQFGAGAAYTAGSGLTQNGNVFDVVSTDGNLTVQANDVTIVSAPKWTSAKSFTLTGDVTGTTSFDGSGAISFATSAVNSGGLPITRHFAGDVGSGTAPVITHNLNTRDITVEVYKNSGSYESVICDVERTTVNTVTLRFATSVTAAAYRCVVTGR